MLSYFAKTTRQAQTLASFDYQWSHLPDGDAMLSDDWFRANVTTILPEITGIAAEWFAGKRVLDAGCGGGRWTFGLLQLGAQVTAVDYSEGGLERTARVAAGYGPLETMHVNLLELPDALRSRKFDLVYSFGVLHHTGDTFRALRNIAELVADDGLIFLYLYGAQSWTWRQKMQINWARYRLAGLSFDQKIEKLKRMYPDRDPHQAFDLLSPVINDRLSYDEVRGELEQLGFVNLAQTLQSNEIYLRGQRGRFDAVKYLRATPASNSLFVTHYTELERQRRNAAYERRCWDLAARWLKNGRASERSWHGVLQAVGLSESDLDKRRVLLVTPDSLTPAQLAEQAGAIVTCLSPSSRWAEAAGAQVATLAGSLLDHPEAEARRYDFVIVLQSALVLTRNPGAAVRALAERLAHGGKLVIETLAPAPEQFMHKVRRGKLKLLPMERKIEKLLAANPSQGVEGAFAALSSRLPMRLTEAKWHELAAAAGLPNVKSVSGDGYLKAMASR